MAKFDIRRVHTGPDEVICTIEADSLREAYIRAGMLEMKLDREKSEKISPYIFLGKLVDGDPKDYEEYRCVICSSVFKDYEMMEQSRCPKCSTTLTPVNSRDDVFVKVNWKELRTLCMWAEQYVDHLPDNIQKEMRYYIMTVSERLQKQYPDKDKLTMFSEIRGLKELFDNTDIKIESEIDNDKKLDL